MPFLFASVGSWGCGSLLRSVLCGLFVGHWRRTALGQSFASWATSSVASPPGRANLVLPGVRPSIGALSEALSLVSGQLLPGILSSGSGPSTIARHTTWGSCIHVVHHFMVCWTQSGFLACHHFLRILLWLGWQYCYFGILLLYEGRQHTWIRLTNMVRGSLAPGQAFRRAANMLHVWVATPSAAFL